jgi:2-hydroxychromene-2-carboxylate isomerase
MPNARPVRVQFLFDFGSPNVYRSGRVIPNVFAAKSQDQAIKNRLMELTQDAVDRGAFGSPAFFVGDEMFFGKDQLRDVEEKILVQPFRMAPSVASANSA